MLTTFVERTRDNLTDSSDADTETCLDRIFDFGSQTELEGMKENSRFKVANEKNQRVRMAGCRTKQAARGMSNSTRNILTQIFSHFIPLCNGKSATGFFILKRQE